MASPIVFKITDAGALASLDAQNNGLSLSLDTIALGSGQYTPDGTETALDTPIESWSLTYGDIEPNSQTLRFSAVLESPTQIQAFEVGIFTDTGVLYAVASTTSATPLLVVLANAVTIAAMGLKLDTTGAATVTISNDPNAPLAVVLLTQHVTNPNPHPQYAMKSAFDSHVTQNALEHANLLTLIMAEADARDLADQQHIEATNPHPQYAFAADINPRNLFRLIHNTGQPYATSSGTASGSVTHVLEGVIYPLGDILNEYDALFVEPVDNYVVDGITMGNGLNKQGYLLRFDGLIQFGNYAGQGDTGFATPTAKIRFLDEDFQLLLEVPLPLTLSSGGFANNGNVGHATYRVSTEFDLYNLKKSNGQTPTAVHAAISASGLSDSDGGDPDLQILTLESFAIFCSY